MIHKSKLPVRFKCHKNMSSQSTDDQDNVVSDFKMTVHVLSDSAFRRYQKEMGYYIASSPSSRVFIVFFIFTDLICSCVCILFDIGEVILVLLVL